MIEVTEAVEQAVIDTREWIENIATSEQGTSGSRLGWIIRNSHGTFMECGMSKFQGRAPVEESECTALIWALQSSWNLGYIKIEFDGDNLSIIRLINGKAVNPRLRHYLDEISHWHCMFTEVKFTFHHREQNKCADILARQALTGPIHYT
ncbi:unnamed protein product [Arabidopsis thaliana]|uniref:RNase H type-1 domain-containing protein n=2 Tax=Arabidopsis thaliana TaxID=3702 RepID=A0A654G802_ARATH|nr:unnamed protein product [Arabidopsis thaliana]